jgi:hypothetical protein
MMCIECGAKLYHSSRSEVYSFDGHKDLAMRCSLHCEDGPDSNEQQREQTINEYPG